MYYSNRVFCNGSEVSASVHTVIHAALAGTARHHTWLTCFTAVVSRQHSSAVFFMSSPEQRFIAIFHGQITCIKYYYANEKGSDSIQACIKDVERLGAIKYMENLRPARYHAHCSHNSKDCDFYYNENENYSFIYGGPSSHNM